jgi:hypothetical protein
MDDHDKGLGDAHLWVCDLQLHGFAIMLTYTTGPVHGGRSECYSMVICN